MNRDEQVRLLLVGHLRAIFQRHIVVIVARIGHFTAQAGLDQFAEALRNDPRMTEVPIIALSSMTSPEAVERGRQVGFHDYIAKFDRPGLIAALKQQAAEMSEAA